MKSRKILLGISIAASILLTACHGDNRDYYDYDAPKAPQNVIAITGDSRIDLTWNNNRESDLAGYNVYFSYNDFKFELIGSTEENYYVDFDAKNGDVYYYAVTAYDYDGNESDLSNNTVVGIARPEGFNQAIFDYLKFPNSAGYSFAEFSVVPFDDYDSDFFFENYNGTYYLNVWEDTDIQDMGSTVNIYDIVKAPYTGWVEKFPGDNIKYLEAKKGHTYVIWTKDNHFAKIRIKDILNQRMTFDWAYQLLEGETLLKNLKVPKSRTVKPTAVNIISR